MSPEELDDLTDALPEGSGEVASADLPTELAILPLRDTVLFPHAVLPLAVARETSVALVNEAVRERRIIGVVSRPCCPSHLSERARSSATECREKKSAPARADVASSRMAFAPFSQNSNKER